MYKSQVVTSSVTAWLDKGKTMPAMPRLKNKTTKIAYKILGVPDNIAHKKTPQEKEISRKLRYEETSRVR